MAQIKGEDSSEKGGPYKRVAVGSAGLTSNKGGNHGIAVPTEVSRK